MAHLLDPSAVLRDEVCSELNNFFKGLPVMQRARWRWIFPEPQGSLGYPRQRVRRDLTDHADMKAVDMLLFGSSTEEALIAPHNRNSPCFKVSPPAAEAWAQTSLRTTTKVFDKLPPLEGESSMWTSLKVWLRMVDAAHSKGLLRQPGGIDAIRDWAHHSSERQRSALSSLLFMLTDFMTAARGGTTTTKIAYGPKSTNSVRDPEMVALISTSSLGRPSTAPIVGAAQLRLENKIRRENAEAAASTAQMLRRRASERLLAGGDDARPKTSAAAMNKSSLPMSWPSGSSLLVTTTQAQMRSVRPSDVITARVSQSQSGNPPASFLARAAGGMAWHGDALRPTLMPNALKAFPSLDSLRGPGALGDSWVSGKAHQAKVR